MAFYNDVAAETQASIEAIDFESILGHTPRVVSRSKTIDTLRQKLQRDPATPLSSVQDLAGVRLEAEMDLDQQDAVSLAVAEHFGHTSDAIRDLRENPRSGYRGVHVWLRLPIRVEVQVRTQLQGVWANLYESTADILGREIRYGVIPEDEVMAGLVLGLHDLSVNQIRSYENHKVEVARQMTQAALLVPHLERFSDRNEIDRFIDQMERVKAKNASFLGMERQLAAAMLALTDEINSARDRAEVTTWPAS